MVDPDNVDPHNVASDSDAVPSLVGRLIVSVLLIGLLIVLSGCSSATNTMGESHEGMDHDRQIRERESAIVTESITLGELAFTHLMARASPLADGNSAAYLKITNQGESNVHLLGASSPIAGMVQLHESLDDNGIMRMEHRPDGFIIEAGESLTLEPGGKHIMLMNINKPLAVGDAISLTLTFADQDPITLTVPVGER